MKDRLVGINRVAKTTKGGRTFSFSAIVVIGVIIAIAIMTVAGRFKK